MRVVKTMSLRYKLTANRSNKTNLCLPRAIRLVSGVSKYIPMNTDDKVSFLLVQVSFLLGRYGPNIMEKTNNGFLVELINIQYSQTSNWHEKVNGEVN